MKNLKFALLGIVIPLFLGFCLRFISNMRSLPMYKITIYL